MKILFQIIYTLFLLIIKGTVLHQLWLWFIVPFFLLPPLSIPLSIGIASMFVLLIHLPIWKFDNADEEWRYNITIGVKPLIILLFGYIVHLFL